MVFDQNTLAGEWREQVRCCEEQDIALDRDIAFALAIADLLELPDDLPLLPAVTAAMSIPTCPRSRKSCPPESSGAFFVSHLSGFNMRAISSRRRMASGRPGRSGCFKAQASIFFSKLG